MDGREAKVREGERVALAADVPPSALLFGAAQAFSYPEAGISQTLSGLRRVREGEGDKIPFALREALDEVFAGASGFKGGTEEKLAYTRLFIGSFKMEAPPYASFYLEEGGRLGGAVAAEVRAVYSQFGLQLRDDEVAPADHLRYLLSFLGLLAARIEETGEEAFAHACADFRDLYLLSWFGPFQERVRMSAEQPYYPALVSFIGKLLEPQP